MACLPLSQRNDVDRRKPAAALNNASRVTRRSRQFDFLTYFLEKISSVGTWPTATIDVSQAPTLTLTGFRQ
jgi:hypothetical protein